MFLSYNCVEFVILEVILMEATIHVEANDAQVVESGHIRDVALCTLALLHPKARAFPVWTPGAQASPCTRTDEHPAQPPHGTAVLGPQLCAHSPGHFRERSTTSCHPPLAVGWFASGN